MKYPLLKTEGVVLKEKEIGEADKLLLIFTKDFGKIEVLGRGIRKIQAKLRFGLQILNHISLEFIKGKNFFIATDVLLKNGFLKLKKEIKKFRQGLYLLSLLDNFIKGEEKDEAIWQLLLEAMQKIEEKKEGWLFVRYFEWNLLESLGLGVELFLCIKCQKRISFGKIYFSSIEGGIICQQCYQKHFIKDQDVKSSLSISHDALKILRMIILKNKKILSKIKFSSSLKDELKGLSLYCLSSFLEKDIYIVS